MSNLDEVYWYLPDYLAHKEHKYLEEVATKIIFTKPSSYNEVRFRSSITVDKIVNICPTMFSFESEKIELQKRKFYRDLHEKSIDVVFLGNHSYNKELQISEIARLIRRKVYVIGSGWSDRNDIEAVGPIYGPALAEFLKKVKVGIAVPDSFGGTIDPITVRYFQYPLYGTLGVYSMNPYNRDLLNEKLLAYSFENFVEAADIIAEVLSMSGASYSQALAEQIAWLNSKATSAESVFSMLSQSETTL
ncbi:glycosyltransferase family protein [Pseudohalioglobus lutimaris]|uniref:glycosyltransferase family protein n=1 Tax=Pseudohalioglobus lutimaris TaxID=1737061 RepID=UPI0010548F07|nr:hypothetical protein [Pseudohalioglobus lutimaris]